MPRSGSAETEDNALFTQEEIALFLRVKRSKVWRLIQDSLALERERLFAGTSTIPGLEGQPGSTEVLWQNRGAILLIQHLLQTGPQLVIWYHRHMEAQEAERDARKILDGAEREYTPGAGTELQERPDFDL